nr:histone-lysine n-methyltransferase e(z) [Quercus suber]
MLHVSRKQVKMATSEIIDIASSGDDRPHSWKRGIALGGPGARHEKRPVINGKGQSMNDRPAQHDLSSRVSGQKTLQVENIRDRHVPNPVASRTTEKSYIDRTGYSSVGKVMRTLQAKDAQPASVKSRQQFKSMSSQYPVLRTPGYASSVAAGHSVSSKARDSHSEHRVGDSRLLRGSSSDGHHGELCTHKVSGSKRFREEAIVPLLTTKKRRVETLQVLPKPLNGNSAFNNTGQRLPKSQRLEMSYFDKEVVDLTGGEDAPRLIVIEDDDDTYTGISDDLRSRVTTDKAEHFTVSNDSNPHGSMAVLRHVISNKAKQPDDILALGDENLKADLPHMSSAMGASALTKDHTQETLRRALKQRTKSEQTETIASSEVLSQHQVAAERVRQSEKSVMHSRKTLGLGGDGANSAKNKCSPSLKKNLSVIRDQALTSQTPSVMRHPPMLTQQCGDPAGTSSRNTGMNGPRLPTERLQESSGITTTSFKEMDEQKFLPGSRDWTDSLKIHGTELENRKKHAPTSLPVPPAGKSENVPVYRRGSSSIIDRTASHRLEHATSCQRTETAGRSEHDGISQIAAARVVLESRYGLGASVEALPILSLLESLPISTEMKSIITQVCRGNSKIKLFSDIARGKENSTELRIASLLLEGAGVRRYGMIEWNHMTSKLESVLEQRDKHEDQPLIPALPGSTVELSQISETPITMPQIRSSKHDNQDDVKNASDSDMIQVPQDRGGSISPAGLGDVTSVLPELDPANSTTEPRAVNHVERVLGRHLEELSKDSEYWTRALLKRARCSKGSAERPTSMPVFSFSALRAVQTSVASGSKAGSGTIGFATDCTTIKKKLHFTAPVTSYKVKDTIPAFSHYVDIKKNFLALNQKTMISWPYFGDDYNENTRKRGQDPETEIGEVYSLDILYRPTKLLHLIQAQRFEPYVEAAMNELGICWTDILHFLLDLWPDVGTSIEAKGALSGRRNYCVGELSRKSSRLAIVLSSIPNSEPDKLATAALLFENFQKMTRTSLWHVARRHMLDQVPAETLERDERQLLDKFTCRVCLRFQCPYHGEIQESDDNDDAATDDALVDGAAKDIVNPKVINSRERVEFRPVGSEARPLKTTVISLSKGRHSVQTLVQRNLVHDLNELGPFYPCHHPGQTCEDAHCTCFESRILCEKTCTCSSDCLRKFHGCSCSSERKKKGQKMVCFEDERCACLRMSRECDPDLCGTCDVATVLDPHRRHDPEVLVGRCHNASVQRGVTKHTIVGKSLIAGLGLFTTEHIEQHEFVGEYKGEIISHDEAERRWTVYQHQGLHYIFSLNAAQEIDGTYYGNKTRFVNHARQGKFNLYPKTRLVNSVHRIALYAVRKIRPGEELFFDYGPMFPDELVGGKTDKKNVAPRVENLKDYYDVEQTEDEHGTLHARKVTVGSTNSKFKTNTRINETKSVRIGDTVREPAVPDRLHEEAAAEQKGEADTNRTTSIKVFKPKHRLYSYNVSDEDDLGMLLDIPETDEDDDFQPEADASDDEDGRNELGRYDNAASREADKSMRT